MVKKKKTVNKKTKLVKKKKEEPMIEAIFQENKETGEAYERVIKDLEERQKRLDQAISYLRRTMEIGVQQEIKWTTVWTGLHSDKTKGKSR